MKNVILITTLLVGIGTFANAQNTQKKTAKQPAAITQKKPVAVKQVAELKSTATYNASAPIVLSMPRMEADTTGLPAVRNY